VNARVRVLVPAVLAWACVAAAPAPARAQGAWSVLVGHAYSSATALRQPASLAMIKDKGGPWRSQFDAGVLLSGSAGPLLLDAGLRAAGGSARRRDDRVYGAMLRGYALLDAVQTLVAVAGEYEADGGFEVQTGTVGIELTPFGVGALSLGRWTHPSDSGFYWRPWVGLGIGNVFSTGDPASTIADEPFTRAHARIEAAWHPGPFEVEAEVTGWVVDGEARGTNFGKVALSIPLARGFAFTATCEQGRQPPRFTRVEHVTVGIGYRRGKP